MHPTSRAGLASCLSLLFVATGCGRPHAAWPQPNLGASSTRAAVSTGIDVADASRLRPVWRFRIRAAPGESGAMTANPVIADGVVYVEDLKSDVYALDLQTGRIEWRRLFGYASPGPNGLAVADGRVYGVTDDSAFALSEKTGRILWRTLLVRPTEQYVEMAPLADGGRVYVSTVGLPPGGRGAMYALDAATGRVEWRFDTIKRQWRRPGTAGGGGAWYPPSVVDGVVYWGTTNPYPYGGTPRYPNGAAFGGAALYTDSLLALDAKTGRLRWYDQVTPHDVRDYDFQLPPVLAGRLLVDAGKAGRVIAWDRRTHSRVWTSLVGLHRNDTGPLPDRRVRVCPGLLGGVETPMAYADGTVFVPVVDLCMEGSARGYEPLGKVNPLGGSGELVALDAATGRQRWRAQLSAPDFGCATVSGGVVFTTTFDGTLLAFDAHDGRRLAALRLSAGTNACPAIAANRLVVAAGVPLAKGQRLEVEAFAAR